MRNRPWVSLFAVGGIASAVALVLGTSASAVVGLPLGIAAAVAGCVTAKRNPGPVRESWALIVMGGAGYVLAGALRVVLRGLAPGLPTFPNPVDVVVALAYVGLIAGTYRMGNVRDIGRNRAAHLDGAIVAVATATTVWTVLLWPYMVDASVPLAARLTNAGFSLLTTVLLAATVRLAVGPGVRSTAYYLLAGAVGLVFVTDVAATLASVHGHRSGLSLILGPFIFSLYGAAALHPALPKLFESPSDRVNVLTGRRLMMLAVGLLVPPALLTWIEITHQSTNLLVPAVGFAILVALVLARFRMLVRSQERLNDVQHILREANASLAAAASRHAMHRTALQAVVRLIGHDAGVRVSVTEVVESELRVLDATGDLSERAVGVATPVSALPTTVAGALFERRAVALDDIAPFDVAPPLNSEARSIFFVPFHSQIDLDGALVVTTVQAISADVRQNVEALASTVSLALESAALTENLLRRRSERRFRALVENSSDIVLVVDGEGRITFASPATNHLLGLPETTLLGSHPARWVHPSDWATVAHLLDQSSEDAGVGADEVEVRFIHLDRSYRWFEIRTRDLSNDREIQGLVVTAREITDRKAAERQVAQSEARFRALVQSSSDAVAVVGLDGCFTYVSPAVTEILGFTPEELIGGSAMALLHPSDIGSFQTRYPDFASGRPPTGSLTTRRMEVHLPNRSGEQRSLDITVTDMRAEPAIGGVVLNARDITVRKALEADLRFQALHDSLTGLANRTMFTQATSASLLAATDAKVGALFIDLDDFKTVNDSLGHGVGDQLLQEVATRLDTSHGVRDVAARLGGDEFALLVVDADDEADVLAVAERVLALVSQPFRIQGREIQVTASIGIAFPTDSGVDAEVLLRNADVAMYLAKDGGKDRYAVFEAHMHESVFERLELKADLLRAIDDGELRCYYQPIVSLETGSITGVEALVRWAHPTRGLMGPESFIPLAEDTGLVVPLGRWVLREACQQLRAWQVRLPVTSSLTMSVNLSVRQLADDNLIDDVRSAISEANIDPSTVTLEITETTLMSDTEVTRRRLDDLRQIGVSLAVDDFGTGYSSLQYVQRFPIDIIKIDRGFVVGLGIDPSDIAVVQSMIELAQRLGVHTVAEGIDRPEQVAILQALGADLGQGFLFSKPVTAAAFECILDAEPNGVPRVQLR